MQKLSSHITPISDCAPTVSTFEGTHTAPCFTLQSHNSSGFELLQLRELQNNHSLMSITQDSDYIQLKNLECSEVSL